LSRVRVRVLKRISTINHGITLTTCLTLTTYGLCQDCSRIKIDHSSCSIGLTLGNETKARRLGALSRVDFTLVFGHRPVPDRFPTGPRSVIGPVPDLQ